MVDFYRRGRAIRTFATTEELDRFVARVDQVASLAAQIASGILARGSAFVTDEQIPDRAVDLALRILERCESEA